MARFTVRPGGLTREDCVTIIRSQDVHTRPLSGTSRLAPHSGLRVPSVCQSRQIATFSWWCRLLNASSASGSGSNEWVPLMGMRKVRSSVLSARPPTSPLPRPPTTPNAPSLPCPASSEDHHPTSKRSRPSATTSQPTTTPLDTYRSIPRLRRATEGPLASVTVTEAGAT